MFGKLKSCPLCKHKPVIEHTALDQRGVKCKCGYGIYWTGENAKAKAIKDWNNRKKARVKAPAYTAPSNGIGDILDKELRRKKKGATKC